MLDLDQIKERLKTVNKTQMARDIKVTSVYLQFIQSGERSNPSYDMMKKISDYLEARE